MKRYIALTLSVLLLMTSGACSHQSEPQSVTETPPSTESPSAIPQTESVTSITLAIGNTDFSLKLYNNDTVTAFLALLPITLNMSELNGNEKYYYLPDSLPTDSQQVGSINAGDLMLYGSDCLVVFYENLNTSYSYTKLGYIEDITGLDDALGRGSVEVSFAVND